MQEDEDKKAERLLLVWFRGSFLLVPVVMMRRGEVNRRESVTS